MCASWLAVEGIAFFSFSTPPSDALVAVFASGVASIPALASTGVSLKTQELYLLVFLTRYLDVFYGYISVYSR